MRRIRSIDTQAELTVRRIAHAIGYRFRIHRRDLPGTPNLVFPSRRVALFVNGCFGIGMKAAGGQLPPRLELYSGRINFVRRCNETAAWTPL